MRPRSIVNFERLYLGSIGLSLLVSPWTLEQTDAMFQANPALAQFESLGRVMTIVALVVGSAVALLLWYFIARRASNVAKWICVAITAYGVLTAINLYVNPVAGMPTPPLTTLPLYVLQLGAIYCLFRKDAVAWLEAKTPVDLDEFK